MSYSKPLNIRGLRIPGDISSGRADGRPLGRSAYPLVPLITRSRDEDLNIESNTGSDPIVVDEDDDETPPPARKTVRNLVPQYSSSPSMSDDQTAGDAGFLPSSMPEKNSASNEEFQTYPLGSLEDQRVAAATPAPYRYSFSPIVPENAPFLAYATKIPSSSSDLGCEDHPTFPCNLEASQKFECTPGGGSSQNSMTSIDQASLITQDNPQPTNRSQISRLLQDHTLPYTTPYSGAKRRREAISDDEESISGGVKPPSSAKHVEFTRERGKYGSRIDAGISEGNILLPSVRRSATFVKDKASRSMDRTQETWKVPATKSKAKLPIRKKQKKEIDDAESLIEMSSSPPVFTSERSIKKGDSSARRGSTLIDNDNVIDSEIIIKTLQSDLAAKDKALKAARKKNADLTKAAKDVYANLVDTRRKLHLMMEGTKSWMEASKNMLNGVEGGPNGAKWGLQVAGAVNFALLEQVREMPELKAFSVAALEASKVVMEKGGRDGMARHVGGFFVGELSTERITLGMEGGDEDVDW